MIIILAFIQGVETSSEIFCYLDPWLVKPCLGPGFSVGIITHNATALGLVKLDTLTTSESAFQDDEGGIEERRSVLTSIQRLC